MNVLELININKYFGQNHILKDISMSFTEGKIHGITGENASGKSTLINIISGMLEKDSGQIVFYNSNDGKTMSNYKNKINTVFQEINLFDKMTIYDNLFLNRKLSFHSKQKMYDQFYKIMQEYNLDYNPKKKVGELGAGEKRVLEIIKATINNPEILILDEPTAFFLSGEEKIFIDVLESMRKQQKTIIYISHRIDELLSFCDDITIMYNGRIVMTLDTKETNEGELLKKISGKEYKNRYPKLISKKGKMILKADNIHTQFIKDISFSLFEGEVLGITGLVGCGKSSIGRAIMGLERITKGCLWTNKGSVKIKSPRDAKKLNIGYIEEDSDLCIIPRFFAKENISLGALKKVLSFRFINDIKEIKVRDDYFKNLYIPDRDRNIATKKLSGGTKQKVCIARLLFSDSKIMIMDEPTAHIDSAAKSDVYNLINELTVKKRKSIILISSDISEILGVSDRIIVLNKGRIAKILQRDEATKESVLIYATKQPALGGIE